MNCDETEVREFKIGDIDAELICRKAKKDFVITVGLNTGDGIYLVTRSTDKEYAKTFMLAYAKWFCASTFPCGIPYPHEGAYFIRRQFQPGYGLNYGKYHNTMPFRYESPTVYMVEKVTIDPVKGVRHHELADHFDVAKVRGWSGSIQQHMYDAFLLLAGESVVEDIDNEIGMVRGRVTAYLHPKNVAVGYAIFFEDFAGFSQSGLTYFESVVKRHFDNCTEIEEVLTIGPFRYRVTVEDTTIEECLPRVARKLFALVDTHAPFMMMRLKKDGIVHDSAC